MEKHTRDEDFTAEVERLVGEIIRAAQDRKRPFKPVTVLVDGPSGAGKTWLSATLSERTGWRTVHLDEFYPGWKGLQKGSAMVAEQVLRKNNPGYWRWDWDANLPGDWASLDARDELIVEGAGAITKESIAAAEERGGVVTVYVDGPVELRRERAIKRDPGYEPWFEDWAEQEKVHFAAWGPEGIEPEIAWRWE
jgi:adenylate kinase family enzyme